MKDVILHPHFTGKIDSMIARAMTEAGFGSLGQPVHHLVVPSRGRPEFDSTLGNMENLRRHVESRGPLIGRAEPGSFIQVNFEPRKGGQNPSYTQYLEGLVDLGWFACAAALVSAVRASPSLADGVGVCLYAAMRCPPNTSHKRVNDRLRPLFNELDLVTSARYCVGPAYDPYPEILRQAEDAKALGLSDRWALQIWTVHRNDQTTPIHYEQAERYAQAIRDSGVKRVIGYAESNYDAQAGAEAEGWRRLGRAIKGMVAA